MKRGYFILVFVLLSFLLLYSRPVTTGNVANIEGACFSEQENAIVDSFGEKPAKFYYESQETKNWKFGVDGADIWLYAPAYINNQWTEKQLNFVESPLSAEKCKYYSLEFKRKAQIFNYDLPRKYSQPRIISDELICEYSASPIENDIGNILGLGGKALKIENICPSEQNKKIGEGISECPPTAECDVSINEGEKVYYGFSLEKDSCGNVLIKEDNDGNPILQSEINSRAENFVNVCSQAKRIASARIQPPGNGQTGGGGGGGSGGSSRRGIGCENLVVKECSDNRDNDNDNLADFPSDRGCVNKEDDNECDDENELTCNDASLRQKWCCPRVDENYFRRECGFFNGKRCRYFWYIQLQDIIGNPDIKLLPGNGELPPGCDCSNSALFIVGDTVKFFSEENVAVHSVYLNYAVLNYNKLKSENGNKCVFWVFARDFEQVDDLVLNPATGRGYLGKFRRVVVNTHGSAHGTQIDLGGSFGSLICRNGGYAEMLSCAVGDAGLPGLFGGLPKLVENYCSSAPPGARIKVSKTNVQFGIAEHILTNERPEGSGMLTCAIGNWECYECTSQYPPRANKVLCDDSFFKFHGE